MISFSSRSSLKKTERYLRQLQNPELKQAFDRAGRQGVEALRANTPVDSGATAAAWSYRVTATGRGYTITWTNSNAAGGAPLPILLQYGHGTGTGGYVSGIDFINPAMKPVFDQIADDIRKAVKSAWQ